VIAVILEWMHMARVKALRAKIGVDMASTDTSLSKGEITDITCPV
jgi:hypothetical protein